MRDDPERRLAARLNAYESRVPDEGAPPINALPRRAPVLALIGTGALAAVAAGLLAVVLLQPPAPADVGETSPTPAATHSTATSATPLPSVTSSLIPVTPGATVVPATPEPTAEPTPGPVVRWSTVGSFSTEGSAEEVRDMAYAAGHFIAIGYREPVAVRGQVGPPQDDPLVWISTDGRAWDRLELGRVFADAYLGSVVALPDGSAAIYGAVATDELGNQTGAGWRSTDGITWSSLELARPRDEVIWDVADGSRGLITVVGAVDTDASEIWHSSDGTTWSTVRVMPRQEDDRNSGATDWAAGNEGFIVTGYRSPLEGGVDGAQAWVLASGDGLTWFEAEAAVTPSPYQQLVAPVGNDWIVAASEVDSQIDTWFSTNGLGWDRLGGFEVPVPDHELGPLGATVGGFVSSGERVIASGSMVICCHGPWWGNGVWSSFDGRTWERLGFPDGTVVSAAAEHNGVVVLAGFDRARPEDRFEARATFWIGDRLATVP